MKPHGTYARYVAGCRCQACRDKAARYERGRAWDALQGHTRLVPAIGFQRRAQALMWMGWSGRYIAARLDVDERNLSHDLRRTKHIRRSRHEAMARLFSELCMTIGPSARTRTWARKNGWLGPLAWDCIDDPAETPHGLHDPKQARGMDEIAVERRMAGDHVSLTTEEAREVVERLRRCGLDDKAIERRTRLNPSRYCGSRERRAS